MKGNGKKKRIVDWEGIEGEYRLGIKSIRSIADKYKVHVSVVSRYATRHKWERDLTQKVQQSTKTKLVSLKGNIRGNNKATGNTEYSTEGNNKATGNTEYSTEGNSQKENDLIENASDEEVERITKEEEYLWIKEQAIIEKASNVAVEIIESQREQIDQHRSVYMKIMGNLKEEEVSADNRHEMSRSLNTAMSSLTQAIKLQRQAYNMDDTQDPTRDVTSLLDMIEYEDISNNK